jgi:hypothetical protein
LQHAFGLARVTLLAHHAVVFRAELLAQLLTAALTGRDESDRSDDDHYDYANCYENHHSVLIHNPPQILRTSGARMGCILNDRVLSAGNAGRWICPAATNFAEAIRYFR